MIDPATHITTPAIESTLEVVRNQFEAWLMASGGGAVQES